MERSEFNNKVTEAIFDSCIEIIASYNNVLKDIRWDLYTERLGLDLLHVINENQAMLEYFDYNDIIIDLLVNSVNEDVTKSKVMDIINKILEPSIEFICHYHLLNN